MEITYLVLRFSTNLKPSVMRSLFTFVFVAFILHVNAQISVTTLGSPYTENFSGLSTSSCPCNTFPTGWAIAETGSNANTTYVSNTGSSGTGDSYNYNSGGADEALGGLLSGSLTPRWGAVYTNNTGSTITSLAISYVGETWRVGAASRVDRIDFQYNQNASSITAGTGTWVDYDNLDYANPGQATGSGSIQHTANISSTITGLNIPNGQSFAIRFNDFNATGSDDGMASDDFSLTANASACAAPTENATAITFTNVFTNSVRITGFTAPTNGADGYVVKMNDANSFSALSDGDDPTADVSWNDAGEQVVYNGTSIPATLDITGLDPSTTYYFKVYSYKCAGRLYNSDETANSNPDDVTTAAPTPFINVSTSSLTGFNTTTGTQSTSQSYQITASDLTPASGSLTVNLSNTTDYEFSTDNSTFQTTDLSISYTGGQIASGDNILVYVRIQSAAAAGTPTATIKNYGGGVAVGSSMDVSVSGTVIAAQPATQAHTITFASVQSAQMDINWTNGDGASRLVVIRPAASSEDAPDDGSSYSADLNIALSGTTGASNYVVYSGNGSGPITVTGLTPSTNYTVRVYEFNGSSATANYNTTTATDNPNSQTTAAAVAASYICQDFEGGSLSSWGSTTNWSASTVTPITNSYSLNHAEPGCNAAGKDYIYYDLSSAGINLSNLTTTWQFNLKNGFDASGSNYFGVFLTANSLNLGYSTAIDGYVVGVNLTGTDDAVKLYEVTNLWAGSPTITPIITSTFLFNSASGKTAGIKVTRSSAGLWELFIDNNGGFDALVSHGTATNTTYNFSSGANYFGLFFEYTSTRSCQLWLDDVSLTTGSATCASGGTYTWEPTSGTHSYADATKWNPDRNLIQPTDVLLFNQGGSSIANNVPTQSIAQLFVSNNTDINLQAETGATRTLTISGGTGDDLTVAGDGSSLNLSGNTVLTLAIATGATGVVSGNMSITDANHAFTAADASGLIFENGSGFYQNTGAQGNAFGSAATPNNTVVFQSGAIFYQNAVNAANPFALTSPDSKVQFQSGSLYKHQTSTLPSLAGRTYANFELDYNNNFTPVSGTNTFTVNDLTIKQGNLVVDFPVDLRGDLTVTSGGFSFNPSSSKNFIFNNGFDHDISGSGTINFGVNATVSISTNITLTGATPNVDGTLNRTAGTMSVIGGSGAFTYGASATLNYTGTTSLNANADWPNTGSTSAGPAFINIENGTKVITISTAKEVKGVLRVKTNNTLVSNGNLTLQSDASLLHGIGTTNGGGTVTGEVVVKRTGQSSGMRYNYWSSPVDNEDVSILGANLYSYNPSGATDMTLSGWTQGWVPASGNMTAGRGYISTGGNTVSFSGNANNANTGSPITVDIEKNDGVSNNVPFNLIGNPFPSSIDAELFMDVNGPVAGGGNGSITGSLYFWDDDGTAGTGWAVGQDYAVWSGAGSVQGPNTGRNFAGHIASGQGFFVEKVTDGNTDIEFRNSMRSATNTAFFRQGGIERFWMNITNPDNRYNETLIAFIDDATDSVDLLYDSKKLKGNSYISLYTEIVGDDYAIQALPKFENDREIALVMDAGTAGTHTLRLKTVEGFDESVTLILEDRDLGVFQNLNLNPEYAFTTNIGTSIHRFYINMNPALKVSASDESCTGTDGSILLQQDGSKKWNYRIVSAGQVIYSGLSFNGSISFRGLTAGEYLVELTDQYGYRVLKSIQINGVQHVTSDFKPSEYASAIQQPIHFSNYSTGATDYEWNFGDGTVITGVAEPVHSYLHEGTYTVTLRAFNGDCEDIMQTTVHVNKLSVGINNAAENKLQAYSFNGTVFLNFEFAKTEDAEVTILNLLGQQIYRCEMKTEGAHQIRLQEARSQYVLLSLQTADTRITRKLFILE